VDHVVLTVPTVTVEFSVVEGELDEVIRSCRVCPFSTIPLVTHGPPPMLICGEPDPVIDASTGKAPSPLMVIVFDVVRLFKFAPITLTKPNEFGEALCPPPPIARHAPVAPDELVAVVSYCKITALFAGMIKLEFDPVTI
jgi:hypothetical protein